MLITGVSQFTIIEPLVSHLVITMDIKNARLHIYISPSHRPFSEFKFKGRRYQYSVLLLRLSLALHTITKCIDAALASLKTDESARAELPRRLADNNPIRTAGHSSQTHTAFAYRGAWI